MARPNQAYYNKKIKEFEGIKRESEDLNCNCNFDLIDDRGDLWDCLVNCSDIYDKCISLINKLEELTESQRFEMEKTEIKYQDRIRYLMNIKGNLISNYKDYKSGFEYQFSDAEMESIKGFSIDRE